MVHVGVDLDKRSSQIAVLSEDGEIAQHRLANDAARLEKFFADLPPQTPIAIEASGTWWWLVDLLERARASTGALESQADEGHRGRPPQERPCRRRAAGAVAPRRPPAHCLDPARRPARGARTHPPPHPARLAPRRDPQSAAGHARAAQPAADVGQELAHAARPARVEAPALDRRRRAGSARTAGLCCPCSTARSGGSTPSSSRAGGAIPACSA